MGTCPHCDYVNLDRAAVCSRCAGDLFVLAAITLATPLPAPMVEPIDTPPKPPPDSKPLSARPALTVSYGGKSAIIPQQLGSIPHEIDLDSPADMDAHMIAPGRSSEPAAVTLHDFPEVAPATVAQSDDRIAPGGTLPAHPGLNEYPMNDAALQHSPQVAAPSTDMADQSQTPVPPAVPPKLLVLRGLKISVEYPIYEGRNTLGRFADKPVDIDLLNQESVEQIWCSRQHATITFQSGIVFIEDLNSLNGTWVNGARVHPGQQRQLKPGDIVQVGTVQMKLVMG
jgi:hypothetical protein